jgi:transcriptional regulator with XRE-family HTH domain
MRNLSNTNASDEDTESTAAEEETLADRLQMIIGSESVASFARRSGVGESVLRKYLNGASPNSNNLVLMADAGGCYVDWLACGRPPIMRADPVAGTERDGEASDTEDEFLLLKRYRAADDDEKAAVRALLEAIANPGGGAWYRVGQAITSIANIFPRKK